jgi:hypothetical protein
MEILLFSEEMLFSMAVETSQTLSAPQFNIHTIIFIWLYSPSRALASPFGVS